MTAGVQAGELRERVVLEAPVDSPDGAGGAQRSWQAIGKVWARVTPLAAERHVEADRAAGVRRYRVHMRSRADIRRGQRLQWAGAVLEIDAVRPLDAARQILELSCVERD